MGLKTILGFNHLPKSTTNGKNSTGYGLAYSDTGFASSCDDNSATSSNYYSTYFMSNYIDDDGWYIARNLHGANYYALARMTLAKLGITGAYDFILGVRCKVGGRTDAKTFLSICDATGNSSGVVLLLAPDLPAVNTEYYYEFKFSLSAGTIMLYRDNVYLKTLTLTSAQLANITGGTGTLVFGPNSLAAVSNIGNGLHYFRDLYVLEDFGDGQEFQRLGPQRVLPLTLASASGDFTASSGTVLDALNTAITTDASATTPLVTGQSTSTGLKLKYTLDTAVAKINAVGFRPMAYRGADSCSLQDTLTLAGKTLVGKTDALATTMGYRIAMLAARVDPSGNAWTAANLAAAEHTLKVV